jgi:hypothetical protein
VQSLRRPCVDAIILCPFTSYYAAFEEKWLVRSSVVNNINNTYIGNMEPLAILLYCQVVRIVLRNITFIHIVLYCQGPNILAIQQYIQYIARDRYNAAAASKISYFGNPVSQTMTSSIPMLRLHHSRVGFDDP